MKITNRQGKTYPVNLEWGKEEYWQERIKQIWTNHKIKGIAPIGEIERVDIGDSEFPFNIITLNNGMTLYDEENSPSWAFEVNQKKFILR